MPSKKCPPVRTAGLMSLAVFVFCLCQAISPRVAGAQMTVDNLIGKSVTDISDEMAKPIQRAITLFANKQFDDARELLKETRTAYPQLPPAGVIMAQMFVGVNQGLAARGELERTVLKDPSDPEPFLVFGDLAFQNRQITESGLCFDRANDLCATYNANPKRKRDLQIRAYAGQAAVAAAREQHELEEQMLNNWAQIESDSTAAYTRLGRCQFKQKGKENEERAFATFRKLYNDVDKERDLTKKVPRPEVNMAVLYTQDDRVETALKLMNLAMQQAAPNDINTRLAVSQWALENGKIELAKKAGAAAYKADPKSLQAILLMGVAYRYEKRADLAEKWFRAALSKAPSNFAAMNNLALLLIEEPDEGKRKQALEYAQLNQRINNDLRTAMGREAAATLAWAAFHLGRETDAEKGMLQILQAGSVSNESAYHAAKIMKDRGRNTQARQILEPLVKQRNFFPGKEQANILLAQLSNESDLLPAP